MTLIKWTPVNSIVNDFDLTLEKIFNDGWNNNNIQKNKPSVDVIEKDKEFVITTDLPGFDKNTQFTTIIEEGEGMIWFLREVNGRISLRVPISGSATIETVSDGKENLIIVGDGESVNIIIRQES